MSLSEPKLWEIVKKQYVFKLKANLDSLGSLVWIQLLALMFSLMGTTSYYSGGMLADIEVGYYTADIVIVFTMIWSFTTAITITTKPIRNQDFTFVTNRLSSSLSNILFLITASIIGAVTSILSTFLLRIIRYLFFDGPIYVTPVGFREMAIGIGATALYMLFIGSLGYLIGSLVQVSKLFIFIIPALVIGDLVHSASLGQDSFILNFFQFFVLESSFSLFLLKILCLGALLFAASMSILNRLEVRK